MLIQQRLEKQKVKYNSDPYNKSNNIEQWIRITDGCPHNCPYCYCPTEIKTYDIPKIIRNQVTIIDMNILANPNVLNIFNKLEKGRVNNKVVYYNFKCGFDYRYINRDIAKRIKQLRVKIIKLAWDWFYEDQIKIKKTIDYFLDLKYKPEEIMIFMICNWKLPYTECCKKLDLLKIWGVKVSDCYYDNQVSPNIIPLYWTEEEIKEFRKKCRTHNHLVKYKFDPTIKC